MFFVKFCNIIYILYIKSRQFLNQKIVYINVREFDIRGTVMKRDYGFITLKAYVETYLDANENGKEKEIELQVEKYLIAQRRSETNAKIIEALLA